MSRPTKVVFVCLHGAAKSVIAAEHFRRRAAAADLDVEVSSGGVEPDTQVPPPVVSGLGEEGFDVAGLVPPALSDTELASADVVVSFGCDIEAHCHSVTSESVRCPISATRLPTSCPMETIYR